MSEVVFELAGGCADGDDDCCDAEGDEAVAVVDGACWMIVSLYLGEGRSSLSSGFRSERGVVSYRKAGQSSAERRMTSHVHDPTDPQLVS